VQFHHGGTQENAHYLSLSVACRDWKDQSLIDIDKIEAAAKAPDRTHYEMVSVSMASLVEMQAAIAKRDAVLKQALSVFEERGHYSEAEAIAAIKGVLND
jgi:hypothetical protein